MVAAAASRLAQPAAPSPACPARRQLSQSGVTAATAADAAVCCHMIIYIYIYIHTPSFSLSDTCEKCKGLVLSNIYIYTEKHSKLTAY